MILLTPSMPPKRNRSDWGGGGPGLKVLAALMLAMCGAGACMPSPKAKDSQEHAQRLGLPALADAPMHLRGVTLTSRDHQQVTLMTTLDTAYGDAKHLHLVGVVVHSPSGAVARTAQADWDTASHALRSDNEVTLTHPMAQLRAPGALFDTRTGEVVLIGPITGEAAPKAGG